MRLWIGPLVSVIGWLLQLPLLLEGLTAASVALFGFATLLLGLTTGMALGTWLRFGR